MTARISRLDKAAFVTAFVALGACMFLPQNSILRPVAGGTLIAVLAVVGWYLALVVLRGIQHHRLVRVISASSVPDVEAGLAVERTNGIRNPFVAGLRQPVIFWPSDLADRIGPDELRAVLLHEDHHRRTYAPMKLLLIEALATGLPFAGIRRWARDSRASIEIAADRYALAAGADRSALAAALMRLSDQEPLGAAGFATAAEIRVRALLGDDTLARRPRGTAAFALVAVAVALICLVFYLL